MTGALDSGLSLHDLAVLMMTVSDNTATNVLMERLGIAKINQMMYDAGMANSRLHRKIRMTLPEKPKHPFFATGTPRDYMRMMAGLYAGDLLNKRNTKAVIGLMRVQSYMGTLWRYLDFDPAGDADEWVASKNGYSSGIRTEAGIVHTKRGAYAICVMGKDIQDKAWTPDNESDSREDGERARRIGLQGGHEMAVHSRLDARRHPAERTGDPGQRPQRTEKPGMRRQQGKQRRRAEHGDGCAAAVRGIEARRGGQAHGPADPTGRLGKSSNASPFSVAMTISPSSTHRAGSPLLSDSTSSGKYLSSGFSSRL